MGIAPLTASAITTLNHLAPLVLPPGMSNITKIVAWVTGLAGVALIVAWIVAIGSSGLKALRHGSFEGGTAAVVCLVCGVALGATSAIFAALGITGA